MSPEASGVEPAPPVGILGATSFVGGAILPRLVAAGWRPITVSRGTPAVHSGDSQTVSGAGAGPGPSPIAHWIALCPIWVLPEHGPRLEAAGAQRVVALSSTSLFTKRASSDASERRTASALAAAERAVLDWAARSGIVVTILRPTLIYDGLHDRNIAMIAGWIRRWGFFPVVGAARGLRQPVHVDDVAAACIAALTAASAGAAYDLSGGEALPYRRMVERVFEALGRPARIVSLPGWLVRLAVPLLRALPRYRHVTTAMFDRMDDDLVFDHAAAVRDLGFSPRPFVLPSAPPAAHP